MTLLSTVSSQLALSSTSRRDSAERAAAGFEDLTLLGNHAERPPRRPEPAWRYLLGNGPDGLPYFPPPGVDGLPVEPQPEPDGLPYFPSPDVDSLPGKPKPQPNEPPFVPKPVIDSLPYQPDPKPDGLPYQPGPHADGLPYNPQPAPDGLPFQPPKADHDLLAKGKLAVLLSGSQFVGLWK